MFAHPRIRKAAPLPPPPKKRKRDFTVEEINFDDSSREEYLTGFHKRKLQRVKHAQEEAAKKARQERIEARKQLREERKREVEDHVNQVNALLKGHNDAGRIENESSSDAANEDEEWEGFADELEPDDHEEEYIDEDKYTTVTVESVSVSRGGLQTPEDELDEESQRRQRESQLEGTAKPQKKPKEKKKKKFTYETKLERKLEDSKRKAKKIRGRQSKPTS